MSKIGNILNGWKNYIWDSPEIEALAIKRAAHCSNCDQAVESEFWALDEESEEMEKIKGLVCNGCEGSIKCPLSTKLRSEGETCPKQLW